MNGQADAPEGGKDERDGAAAQPAEGLDAARSPAAGQVGVGASVHDAPAGAAADDGLPTDEAGPGADDEVAADGADEARDVGGEASDAEGAAALDAAESQSGQDAEPAAGVDDTPDPALLAEGARIAEALIFASDRPVTPAMLGAVLPPGLVPGAVVAALAEACEGRGVAIAEVAGGWAFRTAPDLAQRLTKVVQAPRRLPRAAMEALSIIAYHQPCTRGEIEEIRGAALAQTTLEALLELGLVAPRGRREVPGRPTLWGTTPKFLEQFSLKALSDLPRKEELVTAETGPALPLGDPAEPRSAPPADEATTAAEGSVAAPADAAPPDEAPGPDTADGAAS
jgi:segregation and condensation protein B